MKLWRAESLNDSPTLVQALVEIANGGTAATPANSAIARTA